MAERTPADQPARGRLAIHLMPHPVAAKRFVEPLAQRLVADGWQVELWIEDIHGQTTFTQSIRVPLRVKRYSLRGNFLQLVAGAIDLWSAIRAAAPRLVEAHQTRDALLPLLIARLTSVPVRIYHNHGVPYIGYSGLVRVLLKAIEWINCRLATHVLTVSQGMQEVLVSNHIVAASKCTVLGAGSACGLDLAEFSMDRYPDGKDGAKQAINISSDAFLALFVGRPERRKGAHRLLHLWSACMLPNDLLILAGVTRQQASSICRESRENVRAMGYQVDLLPYYAAADVVVLPSEHEGFGYALLEGAAMECCLIASRIPGPDSIVVDGVNGFLVPLGDDASLEQCLKRLRDDKVLRRRMSTESRSVALRFSRGEILDAYSAFVREKEGCV